MWFEALSRAHDLSYVQDLSEGYRDLRPDRRSKLTNVLARSVNRAEGYLVEEPTDGQPVQQDL
jgi:hypothetical protein